MNVKQMKVWLFSLVHRKKLFHYFFFRSICIYWVACSRLHCELYIFTYAATFLCTVNKVTAVAQFTHFLMHHLLLIIHSSYFGLNWLICPVAVVINQINFTAQSVILGRSLLFTMHREILWIHCIRCNHSRYTSKHCYRESGLTDDMGCNERFQTACVFPHNENVADAAQLVCLGYDKHDRTSHAASDISHLRVRYKEKYIRVL